MVSTKYYPQLSSVITLDKLPQELNFIQGGITNLLDDIFLKDYQFNKSNAGDSLSYYLVLKIYKRLGIDIPGAGLSIMLNPPNPSDPDPNSTDIPVSVNIQYEILKYISDFSLDSFAATPIAFFNLIIEMLDLLEVDVIDNAIVNFTQNNTVNEFVDAVNTTYTLSGANVIPYPTNTVRHDAILEVVHSIENSTLITDDIFGVTFKSFIENGSNDGITNDNINRLFTSFIGPSPIEKVKKLFLPKVNTALKLKPAIEFPRSVLQPMKQTSPGVYALETDETKKTRLDFAESEFKFSTEGGVGFDSNIIVTFNPTYPLAIVRLQTKVDFFLIGDSY